MAGKPIPGSGGHWKMVDGKRVQVYAPGEKSMRQHMAELKAARAKQAKPAATKAASKSTKQGGDE